MHDTQLTKQHLGKLCSNACSPYNDGWMASEYKKELVMLKHYITKLINRCPDFGNLEKKWEQELIIDILKEK